MSDLDAGTKKREKRRFREISPAPIRQSGLGLFSDSEVFRNFVDAFRGFLTRSRIRTGEMHFFNIDSPQKQNRGQIRTATHFPKTFKNPSRSKFIYKAIDAKHIDKFRLL